MTTLTVRLDRFHRYWPVGLLALIVAITIAGAGVTSESVLVTLVLGAIAGGLCWLFGRETLIVSEDSIVEKGWVLETVVRFSDVVDHKLVLDDDALGVDDSGVGELVLSLLAQFTVRPLRWILRYVVHRDQPDSFYRGVLVLFGYEGKKLIEIRAKDGWADIIQVFTRITDKLERAPAPLPQARLL